VLAPPPRVSGKRRRGDDNDEETFSDVGRDDDDSSDSLDINEIVLSDSSSDDNSSAESESELSFVVPPEAKRARTAVDEIFCRVATLTGQSNYVSITEDMTGHEIAVRVAAAASLPLDYVKPVIQAKCIVRAAYAIRQLREWADVDKMRNEGLPTIHIVIALGHPDCHHAATRAYMSLRERDRARWDLTRLGMQNQDVYDCPICLERKGVRFTNCLHAICSTCIDKLQRQLGHGFPCPMCRQPVTEVL
jgi:hypothetical protein